MATGKAPFDHHLKGIRHAFHEMVKPYSGVINARGTHLGYVTFELGITYDGKTVMREVGPFDMTEDFDDPRMQKQIGKGLADATRDACHEMMDPDGELKTISVREVYKEIGA